MGIAADGNSLVTIEDEVEAKLWVSGKGLRGEYQEIDVPGKLNGVNCLLWSVENQILYTSISSAGLELRSVDVGGSSPKQVLDLRDEAPEVAFDACADGRHMVGHSARSQGVNIWRFDADWSNPTQLTKSGADAGAVCSPDGRWVVYQSTQTGTWTIWKVAIDGGQAVQLTEGYSTNPAISPDGKWIGFLYYPDPKKPAVLAIIPFRGGPITKTFPLPDTWKPWLIAWTPDGRALTFMDTRKGVGNLWIQPVSGGAPKQLTDFKSEEVFGFSWSHDGHLALSRGAVSHDVVMIHQFRAQ